MRDKGADENYWKDAYRGTWQESSKREKNLMDHLERVTGMKCRESGLGAGSAQYLAGSAARNGYEKGDADFMVEGTNIYVEVTGPLVNTVKPEDSLWFRPDKLDNAIRNGSHDVFLAHHCMSADLWRVIHVDAEFKARFRSHAFREITRTIRGRLEKYVEIPSADRCVQPLSYLERYLQGIRRMQERQEM